MRVISSAIVHEAAPEQALHLITQDGYELHREAVVRAWLQVSVEMDHVELSLDVVFVNDNLRGGDCKSAISSRPLRFIPGISHAGKSRD